MIGSIHVIKVFSFHNHRLTEYFTNCLSLSMTIVTKEKWICPSPKHYAVKHCIETTLIIIVTFYSLNNVWGSWIAIFFPLQCIVVFSNSLKSSICVHWHLSSGICQGCLCHVYSWTNGSTWWANCMPSILWNKLGDIMIRCFFFFPVIICVYNVPVGLEL